MPRSVSNLNPPIKTVCLIIAQVLPSFIRGHNLPFYLTTIMGRFDGVTGAEKYQHSDDFRMIVRQLQYLVSWA